ncbi:MAG: acetyl-CoA carboxylase biotin carboxyl carrier protein [PVC group bacterium]|nr:acetyl-CoA carboxylase biotin carboxyl carrier protein [PVC group bacterium]
MNLKEIKQLIALMNDNNLTEFELEREGFKIRLNRGGSATAQPNIVVERIASQEPAAPTQAAAQSAPAPVASNLHEIKSPMVGTFYQSPSPESPPFVEIGTNIEIGQVVCIIEAMKLMNEIKSEVKGTIKEILIENGDPIEFGQALFRIEPR